MRRGLHHRCRQLISVLRSPHYFRIRLSGLRCYDISAPTKLSVTRWPSRYAESLRADPVALLHRCANVAHKYTQATLPTRKSSTVLHDT